MPAPTTPLATPDAAPRGLLVAGLGLYAVLFAVFAALAAAGDGDTPPGRALHALLVLAPALACIARGRLDAASRGWVLVGAGLLAWGAGDLVWLLVAGDGGPSVADALYLGTYPLLFAGGYRLLADSGVRLDRGDVADAAIAGLGTAALIATLAFEGVGSADALAGDIAILAYPLFDLAFVAGAAGLLVALGQRAERTWLLVCAGAVMWAVSDSLWLRGTVTDTYAEGELLSAGWPAAMALIAAGAWLPPRRSPRPPATSPVPLAVAATSIVLLVYDHFSRVEAAAVLLAAASLVAALGRMKLTQDDLGVAFARARELSLTDPVTGLPNRRALMRDLDAALVAASRDHPWALGIYDLDGFKGYNDTFGHPAGDELLDRLGRRLAEAVPHGRAYRLGGDEFCALVPLHAPEGDDVERRIAAALAEDGDSFIVRASGGWAVLPDDGTSTAEILRAADRRMYEAKGRGRLSAVDQARRLLTAVVAERDPTLGRHGHGVADLACEVARELGLDAQGQYATRLTAELHDVGKIALPEAVLQKPGPLSPDEWTVMRQHTVLGERICLAAPALTHVASLVRATHERWDGHGYPDGLAGDEIPLPAQIVFCCDAFDAMVSDRAYRPARPAAEALAELAACAGSQFDPRVVDAFRRVWARRHAPVDRVAAG